MLHTVKQKIVPIQVYILKITPMLVNYYLLHVVSKKHNETYQNTCPHIRFNSTIKWNVLIHLLKIVAINKFVKRYKW